MIDPLKTHRRAAGGDIKTMISFVISSEP